MHCTGHTSTHARSFVSMHASVMIATPAMPPPSSRCRAETRGTWQASAMATSGRGWGREVLVAVVLVLASVAGGATTAPSVHAATATPLVTGDLTDPAAYPAPGFRGIKAVQPDFWP